MPISKSAINSIDATQSKQTGIGYVKDNPKYPDFIRNHPVFNKLTQIHKVFPKIGLPNSEEEIEFNFNIHDETRLHAQNLIFRDMRNAIGAIFSSTLAGNQLNTLMSQLYNILGNYYSYMIFLEDGKITLKWHQDAGVWDGKPYFRQGESLFKGYTKLVEFCKTHGLLLQPLDTLPNFKSFSSSNIPSNKKFKLIFSSSGAEGLWDIATISMRGINSCQTWGTAQSFGLIGSMSSKYVGVMYITSGDVFNEHGSKMIRRAMVRFCINRLTKKPGILVDRIYPAHDAIAEKIFTDFLSKKTNLPVIYSTNKDWPLYNLPSEDTQWNLAPLAANEFTYMDTKIPWLPKNSNATPLAFDDCQVLLGQIDRAIGDKIHNTITFKLDEYLINKKVHRDLFKGGVANLISSTKQHIGGAYPFTCSLPKTYNLVGNKIEWLPYPTKFLSKNDFEKELIKSLLLNSAKIKNLMSINIRALGKWTKCFPNSIAKLIDIVMVEYKKELMVLYKNIISQA